MLIIANNYKGHSFSLHNGLAYNIIPSLYHVYGIYQAQEEFKVLVLGNF